MSLEEARNHPIVEDWLDKNWWSKEGDIAKNNLDYEWNTIVDKAKDI